MSPLDKLREQVKIARDSGTFVVLTADEAAALLAEVEDPLRLVTHGKIDLKGADLVNFAAAFERLRDKAPLVAYRSVLLQANDDEVV